MRLSYANVTATLALFIALGGSAYAVTKIRGKDIADRTITARNVKKGTLTSNEIKRGAITTSKLSRGVRAQLPSQGDNGSANPGGFGNEGLPGLTGDPGEPGKDGAPGNACDPSEGLLCPDAELPTGQEVVVSGGTPEPLRGSAYKTSCTAAPTPKCTVIVNGPAAIVNVSPPPGTAAATWYATRAGGQYVELLVRQRTPETVIRRFAVTAAVPVALLTQDDRYALTLSADTVVETP